MSIYYAAPGSKRACRRFLPKAGKRGSTAQHLSVLDYKIQKDTETLKRIDRQVALQQKRLEQVSETLTVERQASMTFHELENAGKRTLFGKVELPEKEYRKVIDLAREGVTSSGVITDLTRKLQDAKSRFAGLDAAYDRLHKQTRDFFQAVKLAPQRVKELFADIFTKDREVRERKRTLHRSVKKRGVRGFECRGATGRLHL